MCVPCSRRVSSSRLTKDSEKTTAWDMFRVRTSSTSPAKYSFTFQPVGWGLPWGRHKSRPGER